MQSPGSYIYQKLITNVWMPMDGSMAMEPEEVEDYDDGETLVFKFQSLPERAQLSFLRLAAQLYMDISWFSRVYFMVLARHLLNDGAQIQTLLNSRRTPVDTAI